MAEAITQLPGPYEIFEPAEGEAQTMRITSWEYGLMQIKTSEVPVGKEVKALRIYVSPESKPVGVNWWDITSQLLIAQLMPYLELPGFETHVYTITKYGVKPKARYTLVVA